MTKNVRRYYLYRLLSFVAYTTPMGILFGTNYTLYTKNEYTGLAFWGYVMAVFVALALKDKLTALSQKNSVMTVSTCIFIVSLIMYKVGEQLLVISGMSMLGCLFSTVFERPAEVYKRYGWRDGVKIRTVAVSHRQAWSEGYMGVEMMDDVRWTMDDGM